MFPQPRTDTEIRLMVEVWLKISKEHSDLDRASFWKQVQDAWAKKGTRATLAAIRTLWSKVLCHVEVYLAAKKRIESQHECDPSSPTESEQEDELIRICTEISKTYFSSNFKSTYLNAVRYLLSQPQFMQDKHVKRSLDRFRRSRHISKLKTESIFQENDIGSAQKRRVQTGKVTRSLKVSRLDGSRDISHRDMLDGEFDIDRNKTGSECRGDLISQDVVTAASLTEVAQTLGRSIDRYCNILEQQLDIKLLKVMPDSREKDRLCVEVFEERYARIQQRKKEQLNRTSGPSSEHSFDSKYEDP